MALLGAAALALGACETSQTGDDGYSSGGGSTLTTTTAEPEIPPAPQSYGRYTPSVGSDMTVVGLPFPTGDLSTSALVVHQVMPVEVRRGAEVGYEYHVTNVTGGTLQNVVLMLESQDNLDILAASPRPQSGADGSVLGDRRPRLVADRDHPRHRDRRERRQRRELHSAPATTTRCAASPALSIRRSS